MKKLLDIVDAVGATNFDIENWIRKFELATDYMDVARGSPRLYSRENVLELAFLAALVKSGISPSFAASYCEEFIRTVKSEKFADWILFPAGEQPIVDDGRRARLAFVPSVTQSAILETSKQSKTFGVSVINTGEIVRRVEKLFAED